MQGLDKTLSLFAKNSTVAAFKELVEYNEAGIAKQAAKDLGFNVDELGKSYISKFVSPTPVVHIAELDRELYDKALNLPEAKSVSLKRVPTTSKYQYGKFKGGNTYTTADGELNIVTKDALPQEGWITIDNSYPDYYLFSNDNNTIIISVKDFEPIPIVEDFMPLYEKLKSRGRYNNEFLDDLHLGFSLAASYKSAIIELIIERLYKAWLIFMNARRTVYSFQMLTESLSTRNRSYIQPDHPSFNKAERIVIKEESSDSQKSDKPTTEADQYDKTDGYYGIYPKQVKLNTLDTSKLNYTAYLVQASINDDVKDEGHTLICFQQPESVSYSSSSQFDSVSPRGSQVPFQFYNCANAVSMSFTLKFHIDEVKSMYKDDKSTYTLEEIEDIALLFSRPRQSGNSIIPRLCTIDLPGIHTQGYITSVQVNHTGDLAGELKVDDSDKSAYTVSKTYYNQLELTFEALLVQNISLTRSKNEMFFDTESDEDIYRLHKEKAALWKQQDEEAAKQTAEQHRNQSENISASVDSESVKASEKESQERDLFNDTVKNVGAIKEVTRTTFGEATEIMNSMQSLFSMLFN